MDCIGIHLPSKKLDYFLSTFTLEEERLYHLTRFALDPEYLYTIIHSTYFNDLIRLFDSDTISTSQLVHVMQLFIICCKESSTAEKLANLPFSSLLLNTNDQVAEITLILLLKIQSLLIVHATIITLSKSLHIPLIKLVCLDLSTTTKSRYAMLFKCLSLLDFGTVKSCLDGQIETEWLDALTIFVADKCPLHIKTCCLHYVTNCCFYVCNRNNLFRSRLLDTLLTLDPKLIANLDKVVSLDSRFRKMLQ